MVRLSVVALVSLLGLLCAVEGARAQEGGEPDTAPVEEPAGGGQTGADTGVRFDFHLDLGWYGAAGVGFRADIPVLSEGIVDGAEDDLRVSLGAEVLWFYARDDRFGVYPIVALQWSFYLSEEWSLFPEVGVALLFGEHDFFRTFIAPFVGFGVRYHMSPRNALFVRVSWPPGLQLGITF